MITEREKKNRDELFRLMRENPDLPVVPMVDAEICGDDSGYWCGAWGHASVDEYLMCERYDYMAFKCTSAKTAEKRKAALDYTQARIKIASVKRPTLTGFVR